MHLETKHVVQEGTSRFSFGDFVPDPIGFVFFLFIGKAFRVASFGKVANF